MSASYDGTDDEGKKTLGFHLISIFVGLLLIIPAWATSLHIQRQLQSENLFSHLTQSWGTVCFLAGVLICLASLLLPTFRRLLLPAYVFGHEVSHALFVFLFYGKVSAFKASTEGGYIIANRNNIWIALAPYIFPFWTVVFALLYIVLGIVINVTPLVPLFFFLYGASWMFNLFWTLWMIPLGQSDLSLNGTFLSITIIYLINALGFSLLLEMSLKSTTILDWCFGSINALLDVFDLLLSL